MKRLIVFLLVNITGVAIAEAPPAFPVVESGKATVCRGATWNRDPQTDTITHYGYVLSYSVHRTRVTTNLILADTIQEATTQSCLDVNCNRTEDVAGHFQWFKSIDVRSGNLKTYAPKDRDVLKELAQTVKTGLESKPAGDPLRLYIVDQQQIIDALNKGAVVQEAKLYDSVNNQTEADSIERLLIFKDSKGKTILTAILNQFKLIPSACGN